MDKFKAYLHWGKFLTPIPKCLGVLATLLMAAGQTDDFSLNYENREPIGGYQFMKYSHSFRQTLLQISQSSYEAFLSAHSNMNKIRLSTKTIPDYLKMAVDILVSGNPKLIQQQLHPLLEVVKTSIEDNLAWSSEMVDRFDKLSNLTDEVRLETIASSKDRTDRRTELLDQQETKKLTAGSHKQLINNLDQRNKKDFSGYFRAVDDLVDGHKSTPTAIESSFMDFFQSFVNKGGSQQEKISDSTKPVSELPVDNCIYENRVDVFFLSARSQTILKEYSSLKSIDSASLGKYNATKHEDEFAKHLTETSRKCKPFTSVLQLGNDTIQMMHQLANSKMPSDANEKSTDSEQVHSSRQIKFFQVRKSMEKFNLEAGKLRDIAQIPTKINTSKPIKKLSAKSKASEQARDNALYKIAIHTEELKVLRESIDRNLNLTIRSTEESISILNEMHNMKAEQISMDQAITILRICINEMTDLKETWSQLVIFFDGISNLIKLESGKSLEDFNKQIETTVNSTSFQQRAKLKKFFINRIRDKLLKANQASTMLHDMASIYYSISNDYLMPRVQEMDTKMRFDSSFDMIKERSLLMHSLVDDEDKIGQLITQDMKLLIEKVEQREDLIKREFAFLYEIEE